MQLTRKELYDLVWSKPMTKLAEEFGVSDVALHKKCKKHRVPTPGLGYWAKHAAGKKVVKAHFREIDDTSLNTIVISPNSQECLSPRVRTERSNAEERLNRSPLKSSSETEELQKPKIHPLLTATAKELRSTKTQLDGLKWVGGREIAKVTASYPSASRALQIISMILERSAQCGYQPMATDEGVGCLVGEDWVAIQAKELIDKAPHRPSPAEKKRLDDWDRRAAIKRDRGLWVSDYDRPKIPEMDYWPSGRLEIWLESSGYSQGLRRRFSDGKRQRLETLIDDIVAQIGACGAVATERREERARWKEQCRLAEEERARQDSIRRRLEGRQKLLSHLISLNDQANRIEQFVSQAARPEEETQLYAEFLNWARQEASEIRSLLKPEFIESFLDKNKLSEEHGDAPYWINFGVFESRQKEK